MRRLRRRLKGVTGHLVTRRVRVKRKGEYVSEERTRVEYPVRFFCAGEYGARYNRPHWHAILFNCWFRDSVRLCNGTMRSELAQELWSHGNVVLGEVTPASAAYVAGYTLGKAHRRQQEYEEDLVNPLTGEVSGRRPEFAVMSLKPGIGHGWYEKFKEDLWQGDHAVQDGRAFKVPRYYYEKLRSADPSRAEEIAYARFLRACETPVEESSLERRQVREQVAEARYHFYSERKDAQ